MKSTLIKLAVEGGVILRTEKKQLKKEAETTRLKLTRYLSKWKRRSQKALHLVRRVRVLIKSNIENQNSCHGESSAGRTARQLQITSEEGGRTQEGGVRDYTENDE